MRGQDAQAFLRYLASICHHQDVHFLWRPFLKDRDDDFILELAFAAGARYVVTHNTRDFAGSDQLGQRGQELILDIYERLKSPSCVL